MSLKEIFTNVYKKNTWHGTESRSGRGSSNSVTRILNKKIKELIEKYKFKKIIDGPCGDLNWFNEIITDKIEYVGYDIVEELIIENKKKYSYEFSVKDITSDELENGDVFICRDCLVHISFSKINNFLIQFVNSGTPYLLMTNFTNIDRKNTDSQENILTWRAINFQNAPFNFPKPIETLQEETVEHNKYLDKSMCMWSRDTILHYLKLRNLK